MSQERLRVRQVIVVEGRYDAAALEPLVDGLIITTDGFGIFKDKEKQQLLRELGRARGVLILTDSDAAGFRIRRFVENVVGKERTLQAYVPSLPGKERRKAVPGKEGLLGVEGMDAAVLRAAILNAGAQQCEPRKGRTITHADLFAWGLSGRPDCQQQRFLFLKRLGLPVRLSKTALCRVLNSLYSYEEVERIAQETALTNQ